MGAVDSNEPVRRLPMYQALADRIAGAPTTPYSPPGNPRISTYVTLWVADASLIVIVPFDAKKAAIDRGLAYGLAFGRSRSRRCSRSTPPLERRMGTTCRSIISWDPGRDGSRR